MTKWLVTYSRRTGARWNVVDFEGAAGSEARGIVDLIAIRKEHRRSGRGLKRGDLFEIILIQTKGGSARSPSRADLVRLRRVAKHHRARAIVLASWRRGEHLGFAVLEGARWKAVPAEQIFG